MDFRFLIIFLLLFLCSCQKQSINEGSIAVYRLQSILSDPGDGSGNFQVVESGRNIEFLETGHILTNSNICLFDTSANSIQLLEINDVDSLILAEDCTLRYSIQANNLLLYYPCIEPCIAKYKKD